MQSWSWCLCEGAHANVQATCAHIAANFANAHITSVDLWLSRYRASYSECLAQPQGIHEANVAQEPGDQPAEKSANKKAVFRSVKVTPVTLVKKRPAEFSKIEKALSKPKPKRQKRVISKSTKKIKILQAKTPLKSPAPAGKQIHAPNAYRSVGAEGWRVNCSAKVRWLGQGLRLLYFQRRQACFLYSAPMTLPPLLNIIVSRRGLKPGACWRG